MKKFTAIFLICQFVILSAFPALAAVATPADADIPEEFEVASVSNAQSIYDSLMQYSNISKDDPGLWLILNQGVYGCSFVVGLVCWF